MTRETQQVKTYGTQQKQSEEGSPTFRNKRNIKWTT